MTVFLLLLIIGLIIGYRYYKKNERKKRTSELLNEVQSCYYDLSDLILDNYSLKVCPKCFEANMNLVDVSPTAQSIEYLCDNCGRKIVGKILPNSNSEDIVDLVDKIEILISILDNSIEVHRALENMDVFFVVPKSKRKKDVNLRKSIPKSVRHEVWRRDAGRCIECGSKEKLEFDHIIPVSRGGANTARNIQLLCESCNREKSNKI
nr:HNH endonuclease [uncultured Draconibacterium sp.]